MKNVLLIMGAILCATPAFADDESAAREKDRSFFNFGASTNSETRSDGHQNCKSPIKPEFLTNLPFLEQQLLYSIYSTEIANPILNGKTCSCDMLYPSYDHAIEVFKRDFLPLGLPAKPGSKEQAYITEYKDKADLQYSEAVNTCIKLGVY